MRVMIVLIVLCLMLFVAAVGMHVTACAMHKTAVEELWRNYPSSRDRYVWSHAYCKAISGWLR